jgi:hypothetical protein
MKKELWSVTSDAVAIRQKISREAVKQGCEKAGAITCEKTVAQTRNVEMKCTGRG